MKNGTSLLWGTVRAIAPKVTVQLDGATGAINALVGEGYNPTIGDRCVCSRAGQDKRLIILAGSPSAVSGEWTAWTAIPLGANVTYSDTAEYRPAFRTNPNLQKVELRGLVRPTATLSTNEVIGTLPAGSRPAKICIVLHNTANTSGSTGRLDIQTTGNLAERASPALTVANYISLEAISFSTSADI